MNDTKIAAPRRSPLVAAGVNFSIAAVFPTLLLFVVVPVLQLAMGEDFQSSMLFSYLSFLLPQVCFAVASLIWFLPRRSAFRKVYAPCKWYYFVIALALAFGLLLALNQVNEYFIKLLELMGYTRQESAVPLTDEMLSGWYLVPSILIIAVFPAIFEETIFRGIQVSTLRESGWGTLPTVLICGAMFSLFHRNPEQTLYQFICGACYALLAIRSGSPLPSILAHFVNNAFVIVLGAIKGVAWEIPGTVLLWLAIAAVVALIATLTYLIFFDKRNRQRGGMKGAGWYFLAAGVGISVCVVEWITVLVMGFIA